jgi:hypothetical protein
VGAWVRGKGEEGREEESGKGLVKKQNVKFWLADCTTVGGRIYRHTFHCTLYAHTLTIYPVGV